MVQLQFNYVEDAVVYGKLLTALGELDILPQDPVTWDYGPHRLYQVSILTRDDEPFQLMVEQFCTSLDRLNAVGTIRPQFYSVESYPAEFKNFRRDYLVVYI